MAITSSMNAVILAAKPKYPQEPDFVAELVDIVPQDLYNSLKVYDPKYNVLILVVYDK